MKVTRIHTPKISIELSETEARNLAFVMGCDDTISNAIKEPRAFEFLKGLYMKLVEFGYDGEQWRDE